MARTYDEAMAKLRRPRQWKIYVDGKVEYLTRTPDGLAQAFQPVLYYPGETTPDGEDLLVPSFYGNFSIRAGSTNKANVLSKFVAVSATTKMSCWSFSLPSGPVSHGGTCVRANEGIKLSKEGHHLAGLYICASCYARGGNYMYSCNQLAQACRKVWVEENLEAGTLNVALLRLVLAALSSSIQPKKKKGQPRPAPIVAPNFFRIHDSGDFLWAGLDYYRAWEFVARSLPSVHFWAPTRDHHYAPLVAEMKHRPSNLVIRPSALWADQEPPSVPSLDAGSSASFGLGKRKYGEESLMSFADYNCPAYDHPDQTHSCLAAKCRHCWTHPELTINYTPHGELTFKKLDAAWKEVQLNPRKTLAQWAREALVSRKLASVTDLATRIAAYLAAKGVRSTQFSEDAWFDVLGDCGYSPDDTAAALEGIANYQP